MRCGSAITPPRTACEVCGQSTRTLTATLPLPPPPAGTTRSARPVGAPTSQVESFEDALVPFLGDPHASRTLGRLLQLVAGLMVLYNLVRAGMWAYFAQLSNQVARGDLSAATEDRLLSVGRLVDATTLLFWPTVVAVIVVELLWRSKRRPKDVLQAHGEAYVEATITRVVPLWLRVVGIVLVAGGVIAGYQTLPSRAKPSQVAGFATTRALSSVLWSLAWGALVFWVLSSERHLARRVAKAADPTLAQFSVPYVEPEAENASIGEPAGPGWILRTAGLVILGLFCGIIAVASLVALPSGKDTLASLISLLISGPVLALVVVAFVRRWRKRRAGPMP